MGVGKPKIETRLGILKGMFKQSKTEYSSMTIHLRILKFQSDSSCCPENSSLTVLRLLSAFAQQSLKLSQVRYASGLPLGFDLSKDTKPC
jgi:hypothetical protein